MGSFGSGIGMGMGMGIHIAKQFETGGTAFMHCIGCC